VKTFKYRTNKIQKKKIHQNAYIKYKEDLENLQGTKIFFVLHNFQNRPFLKQIGSKKCGAFRRKQFFFSEF
jgi:hypothetical protein